MLRSHAGFDVTYVIKLDASRNLTVDKREYESVRGLHMLPIGSIPPVTDVAEPDLATVLIRGADQVGRKTVLQVGHFGSCPGMYLVT
jgi:hypothetical protein